MTVNLACHGSIEMSYVGEINEPIEARICCDQTYSDEGILNIKDLHGALYTVKNFISSLTDTACIYRSNTHTHIPYS